jgi:hypothetical protein
LRSKSPRKSRQDLGRPKLDGGRLENVHGLAAKQDNYMQTAPLRRA